MTIKIIVNDTMAYVFEVLRNILVNKASRREGFEWANVRRNYVSVEVNKYET